MMASMTAQLPICAVFESTAMAAGGDKKNEAGDHFRRGVGLYKERDFVAALVEFRRAYELAPNYRVLYDIGQSLFQLQRYADAIPAFEQYLAQGGNQISPVRRQSVEADLKTLRSRVGHLDVQVNLDGAEIRVDDQTVGTSPLAKPVLVSVGHRRITVAKPGRVSLEKFADISAGDQTSLTFTFPDQTQPAPVAQAPDTRGRDRDEETPPPPQPVIVQQPAPPPEPPSSAPLWISWTTTALLGAGTAVTGAFVLSTKASLSNKLSQFPGDADAIESDRKKAKAFATASDILLAATAVSLAVSVYITLSHGGPETHEAASLRDVKLGIGPGRLELRGSF